MSSSEIERHLYITNDPYHTALLLRKDEDYFDLENSKETSAKVLKKDQRKNFEEYFIQQELELNDLREAVKVMQANRAKLVAEITQLSLESGYINSETEVVLPELQKIPG